MYKNKKKVGKSSARNKTKQPESTVKTMYMDGMNSLAGTMCKNVLKGAYDKKTNHKSNSNRNNANEDKENKKYVTYRSLNQRLYNQTSNDKNIPSQTLNKTNIKSGGIRHKKLSASNFRTKQNSPDKRVPVEGKVRIAGI